MAFCVSHLSAVRRLGRSFLGSLATRSFAASLCSSAFGRFQMRTVDFSQR